MSVPPPGATGTIAGTGLAGPVCAWADGPAATANVEAAIPSHRFLSIYSSYVVMTFNAALASAAIDRIGLGEKGMQDMVDRPVVDLVKARVRDAGHHRE